MGPRRRRNGLNKVLVMTLLVPFGAAGCGSDSSNSNATTNSTLTMSCSASPASGQAPLKVLFTINVSGAQGGYPLQINYGDGNSFTDPDPTHIYTKPGTYKMTATTTNAGQTASCTQTINVAPGPPPPIDLPPTPSFRVTPNPPTGRAPLSVEFNMCQSVDLDNMDPLSFTFTFGDGKTFTGFCRKTHKYQARGSYSARICVTDGGPSGNFCQNYTVTAQ